jgi:hypothetical protein
VCARDNRQVTAVYSEISNASGSNCCGRSVSKERQDQRM